jgi:hypothetical protein
MSKIDSEQIAYYGKPIDSLTKDELIGALEDLAGAIQDCALRGKQCGEIIQIKENADCVGD